MFAAKIVPINKCYPACYEGSVNQIQRLRAFFCVGKLREIKSNARVAITPNYSP
jgi:hypothetical protein